MKKTIQLTVTGFLFIMFVAISSNKATAQTGSKYLKGNWTYRSMYNTAEKTPFANLEFATATMRFNKNIGDSVFGVLDMGTGFALTLKGKITTCNGATTFYLQGMGVPNTGTANWQYDYQGYVVPKWTNGVAQADACTGSVIRVKPHGNAKAGQTASFYLVRQ